MQPKKQIRKVSKSGSKAKKKKNSSGKKKLKKVDDTDVFKKGSPAMIALEQTQIFSDGLIYKEVEEETKQDVTQMLDLDNEQGAEGCKTYLCSIENLMAGLGLELSSRSYRDNFSNSYKALYEQMLEEYGSSAAYLPEILDSAQEGFDHLWVNGEKYIFSDHVLESGQ